MYDSDGKWIDIMQVCRNGHVINDSYQYSPEKNQDYCQKCQQPTTTKCDNCQTPIQGRTHYRNVVAFHFKMKAPDYCKNCGTPYLWNKGFRRLKKNIKSFGKSTKNFVEWLMKVIRKK